MALTISPPTIPTRITTSLIGSLNLSSKWEMINESQSPTEERKVYLPADPDYTDFVPCLIVDQYRARNEAFGALLKAEGPIAASKLQLLEGDLNSSTCPLLIDGHESRIICASARKLENLNIKYLEVRGRISTATTTEPGHQPQDFVAYFFAIGSEYMVRVLLLASCRAFTKHQSDLATAVKSIRLAEPTSCHQRQRPLPPPLIA